jgi:ariadne-1
MTAPTQDQLEDWDFINSTAASIRERLLTIDEGSQFLDSIASIFNETNEYPDDLAIQLDTLLYYNWSEDSQIRFLAKAAKSIGTDEENADNAQSFYNQIFVPSDELILTDETPPNSEIDDNCIFSPEERVLVKIEPVITTSRLRERQNDTISHISEVLIEEQWNEAKLIEKAADSRESPLRSIGLNLSQSEDFVGLRRPSGVQFLCAICINEYPASNMLCLPCGHPFCEDCWRDYIRESRSKALIRRCPHEDDCPCRLLVSDVRLLLGDDSASEFEDVILQCHIEADPTLRRCTSPTCEYIITHDAIGLCHVALCQCGQRVCWRCRGEAHSPLACEYLDRWAKITEAESMQAKWICENTKPCPRCNRRIEKNGGCNHMTCLTL